MRLSAATLALAASSFVSAQTSSKCDPTKKSCPPNPALGTKVDCDFTKGDCDFFGKATGTNIKHSDKGAEFSISSDADAPTISGNKYIFFGRVDIEAQAAPGRGIVTSVVLLSDDLDEIDWEWLGGDAGHVQTNYFSKGDTSVYDRGATFDVAASTTQFHKYSIEWTSKSVVWSIDDKPVRTLTADAAKGGAAFPQTPMLVKVGTWVGGSKNAGEGTVRWAGGYADYSQAPFLAYYRRISIVDYAGKDTPAAGGIKEYVYGDMTGTRQSIKVVPGNSDESVAAAKSANRSTPAGGKTAPAEAETSSPEAKSAEKPASSSSSSSSSSAAGAEEPSSNDISNLISEATASTRTAPSDPSSTTLAVSASSANTTSRIPADSDRAPSSTSASRSKSTAIPASAAPRDAASLSAALIAFAALLL